MNHGERSDARQSDYQSETSEPRIYRRGESFSHRERDHRSGKSDDWGRNGHSQSSEFERDPQARGLYGRGGDRRRFEDYEQRSAHEGRSTQSPFEEAQTYLEEATSGRGGSMAPLIGAAAIGFVAGIAANLGRKAVVEATTAIQGDWFDALKAEHRIVEQLFHAILETDDTQTMKRTALHVKLATALAKHDLEEMSVVYPALRMHGRDGEGRHLAADHADIMTYLHELEVMPKDDPNWIQRVRAFQELVLEHVREEEEVIYPAFRDMLTKEQNTQITLKMHKHGLKLA